MVEKLVVTGWFSQGHVSMGVNESGHHGETRDINFLHIFVRLSKSIGLGAHCNYFFTFNENRCIELRCGTCSINNCAAMKQCCCRHIGMLGGATLGFHT